MLTSSRFIARTRSSLTLQLNLSFRREYLVASKLCMSTGYREKSITQELVQDLGDRETVVFQSTDDRAYLEELNCCKSKHKHNVVPVISPVVETGDGNIDRPLSLNAYQSSYMEYANFPNLMNSHSQLMVPFPAMIPVDNPVPGGILGGDLVKHSKFVSSSHHEKMERQGGNDMQVCLVAGTFHKDFSRVMYMDQDFHKQHCQPGNSNISVCVGSLKKSPSSLILKSGFHSPSKSYFKNSLENGGDAKVSDLTQRQKLQRAVKEYGSTVVVFHVGISLMSLGGFYIAVSSGLDVEATLRWMGVSETYLQSKLTAGASTFVLAYAIHKVFAPVRIGITLTCTPLIVSYLRRVGFLKPPRPTSK